MVRNSVTTSVKNGLLLISLIFPCFACSFYHERLGSLPDGFSVNANGGEYRVTLQKTQNGIDVLFRSVNQHEATCSPVIPVQSIPDDLLAPLVSVYDRRRRLHLFLAMAVATLPENNNCCSFNSASNVRIHDANLVTASVILTFHSDISGSSGMMLSPYTSQFTNSLKLNVPNLNNGLQHHVVIQNITYLEELSDCAVQATITQDEHSLVLGLSGTIDHSTAQAKDFEHYPWFAEYQMQTKKSPQLANIILAILMAMTLNRRHWYPELAGQVQVNILDGGKMEVGAVNHRDEFMRVSVSFSEVGEGTGSYQVTIQSDISGDDPGNPGYMIYESTSMFVVISYSADCATSLEEVNATP